MSTHSNSHPKTYQPILDNPLPKMEYSKSLKILVIPCIPTY